jgi:hypothetical protein
MNERHTLQAKKETDQPKPGRGNGKPSEERPNERDQGSGNSPDRFPDDDRSKTKNPPKRGGDDPTSDW